MTVIKFSKYVASDPPLDLLQVLLKYGANPNILHGKNHRFAIWSTFHNKMVRMPLHYAAKTGNLAFVKALVEAGAEIDAVDGKDKMPINYALDKKGSKLHDDIVEFLLLKGSPKDWRETTSGLKW